MTEPGDTGASQAITVLLVEDDAPTCWRLQDALIKAGYEVRTAGTLGEARGRFSEGAPRVLFTDLRLPDGHGVALIRETRQRFPDTEIMVISALGDEESVISAITVGATGYLLKDAFPTDIATTVRDLVAGHSPISACATTRRSCRMPAARSSSPTAADLLPFSPCGRRWREAPDEGLLRRTQVELQTRREPGFASRSHPLPQGERVYERLSRK